MTVVHLNIQEIKKKLISILEKVAEVKDSLESSSVEDIEDML